MNTALISKQVWRLAQESSSYWASTLKAIYYPNCSFWEASTPRGASWVWKSLTQGRQFIRDSGRWLVGTGTQIKIAEDNWLSSGTKAYLTPNASAVLVGDLIDSERKWDTNLLRQNLAPPSAIEAVKTPISWSSATDVLTWPHNKQGVYSVKSGYRILQSQSLSASSGPSSSNSNPESLWVLIWSALVPNKIKHFIWKVCHNILPTRENLCKKRIPVPKECPICAQDVETVEHMFLICPWTKPLWFGLDLIIPPSPIGLTSVHNWMMQTLESKSPTQDHLSTWLFYTLWNIWKARNDRVFSGFEPKPLSVLYNIKSQCSEYLATLSPKPYASNIPTGPNSGNLQDPPVTWRPPGESVYKLNCDAAYNQNTGKGFTGIVCRDAKGSVITASSSHLFAPSAIVAEAISLREAAALASNLGLQDVLFESDCQILVEVCRGNIVRGEIIGIVQDFNELRKNFNSAGITWVKRDGNNCAHVITNLASQNQLPVSWLWRSLDPLRKAIVKDAQALWV